jgi:mannan endo-1,4-beta-mannosidase
MYDRYVNHHKLNNLIWVWNTNAPRDWKDDEAYAYELFYPGAEYVDILAADVYKNDFKQSHHDQLVELGKGKLIALGEVGNLPTPEIIEQQPQWSWFMCWAHFPWAYNTREIVKTLYNSPRVLTLDEVVKK